MYLIWIFIYIYKFCINNNNLITTFIMKFVVTNWLIPYLNINHDAHAHIKSQKSSSNLCSRRHIQQQSILASTLLHSNYKFRRIQSLVTITEVLIGLASKLSHNLVQHYRFILFLHWLTNQFTKPNLTIASMIFLI